jgi:hypothetical protein
MSDDQWQDILDADGYQVRAGETLDGWEVWLDTDVANDYHDGVILGMAASYADALTEAIDSLGLFARAVVKARDVAKEKAETP